MEISVLEFLRMSHGWAKAEYVPPPMSVAEYLLLARDPRRKAPDFASSTSASSGIDPSRTESR